MGAALLRERLQRLRQIDDTYRVRPWQLRTKNYRGNGSSSLCSVRTITAADSAIVDLQASNPKSGNFSNAQPTTYGGALKLAGKVC
jgi:hypothetical protein